jgi:hypothetical protein
MERFAGFIRDLGLFGTAIDEIKASATSKRAI